MAIDRCPACLGSDLRVRRPALYGPSALVRCSSCGTELLDPQPTDARLDEIYDDHYYDAWEREDPQVVDVIKRRTFEPLLDATGIGAGDSILDLGCATGSFLAAAAGRGARPFGIDRNPKALVEAGRLVPTGRFHAGFADDRPFGDERFDAVVMIDFLEHVRDPGAELRVVGESIRPGGRLVIATPRVDSGSRRLLGARWPQYREEHLTFFSRRGIAELLTRSGFADIDVRPHRKALTLSYVYGQALAYPQPVVTPAVKVAHRTLPFLRHRPFRVRLGEMIVVAQRAAT